MSALDNLMRQIPAFKENIPLPIRVGTFLFFVLVFQFSGSIYLASVSQMVGGTALMKEDILMAGYASFVGMTIVFPILFRLKFRFASRTIFQITACILIICNLICIYTKNVPVLVLTCFVAGAIRMWGTFECFSSIQLRITPTRNFAVFFPVIYTVIFSCIQLSGITTIHLTYFYEWKYMHYFIIGMLLIVILLARLLLREFHLMKPLPLFGIDWLGAALWSVILLLLVFVLEYGDHYDWLYSPYIRLALFAALLLSVVHFYRMRYIRHPYIENKAFAYPHIFTILFLYLALCTLSATSTILQSIYTDGILGYDPLNSVSLNWIALIGVILGSAFTWFALVKLRLPYKAIVFIGFALVVGYQALFYFLISPATNKELLYLPLFLKNAGNIILFVVLTIYASQVVPFQHFFQVLCIIGFIREGIGSPIGTALVSRILKTVHQANYFSLSSELDAQNPVTGQLPFDVVFGEVQRQTMLVSIKEVFGYAVLFGLLILIACLFTRYTKILHYIRVPRVPIVGRLFKIKLFSEDFKS